MINSFPTIEDDQIQTPKQYDETSSLLNHKIIIMKNDNTQKVYSKIQHQSQDEQSTVEQASANLFKGFIGIGILAFPVAFAQSGWLCTTILILLVGYGTFYCSCLIIDLADQKDINCRNITELVVIMLGEKMRLIMTTLLFVVQVSCCIGYCIFFTQFFQKGLCQYLPGDYSCHNRLPAILLSLSIVTPLALIKNMTSLQKWSMMGIIISLFVLLVCVLYSFFMIYNDGYKIEKSIEIKGIPQSLGIIMFAFEGMGIFFDIRYSMKEPKEFQKILRKQSHILIFLHIIFGFVCYSAFGNRTQDVIIFNLPIKNKILGLVQLAYCTVLCVSYPLQIFPCVNYIDDRIRLKIIKNNKNESNQLTNRQQTLFDINRSIIRVIFLFIIYYLSLQLTSISNFLNLVGSFAGITLVYVLPVIIYNWKSHNSSKMKKNANWLIGFIGIISGLVGIIQSFQYI